MASLPIEEIDEKVKRAQEVVLDVEKSVPPKVVNLVRCHAEAIGAPFEFILFPLLSIVVHFAGGSKVWLKKDWPEILIIWTVVLADKGQKKSPALSRFIKPIQKLEEALREKALGVCAGRMRRRR